MLLWGIAPCRPSLKIEGAGASSARKVPYTAMVLLAIPPRAVIQVRPKCTPSFGENGTLCLPSQFMAAAPNVPNTAPLSSARPHGRDEGSSVVSAGLSARIWSMMNSTTLVFQRL